MGEGLGVARWIRSTLGGGRGRAAEETALIRQYVARGRVPWSAGHGEYRLQYVRRLLADASLLRTFREGGPLPAGHGHRLDERVVEYPWVFSRAAAWGRRVLDAGSALNYHDLLVHPALRDRTVVLFSLAYDSAPARPQAVVGDHAGAGVAPDGAAAARVVACVELSRR